MCSPAKKLKLDHGYRIHELPMCDDVWDIIRLYMGMREKLYLSEASSDFLRMTKSNPDDYLMDDPTVMRTEECTQAIMATNFFESTVGQFPLLYTDKSSPLRFVKWEHRKSLFRPKHIRVTVTPLLADCGIYKWLLWWNHFELNHAKTVIRDSLSSFLLRLESAEIVIDPNYYYQLEEPNWARRIFDRVVDCFKSVPVLRSRVILHEFTSVFERDERIVLGLIKINF